ILWCSSSRPLLYCFAQKTRLRVFSNSSRYMGDSVEIAPLATAGDGRVLTGLLRFQGWLLVVLVGWLYHSILYNLVLQWGKDPNFSHGFLVPVFSLYLLWLHRNRLKAIEGTPSWSGIALV